MHREETCTVVALHAVDHFVSAEGQKLGRFKMNDKYLNEQ
jgi:hypothetical protein